MKITMKVTLPKKEDQKPEIPYDEIPVGAVYKTKGTVIALKLIENQAVLLYNHVEYPWLKVAVGFKGEPATEILGYIDEIILKEKP